MLSSFPFSGLTSKLLSEKKKEWQQHETVASESQQLQPMKVPSTPAAFKRPRFSLRTEDSPASQEASAAAPSPRGNHKEWRLC